MNPKLKTGLWIAGGAIAMYVLYRMYMAHLAAQASQANDLSGMSFLPPLQGGGYAPSQTSAGTVDTGGAQLNNLLQSILGTGTAIATATPIPTQQAGSASGRGFGTSIGNPVVPVYPVGPAPVGGTSNLGNLSGVGTRIIAPTLHTFPTSTTDGVTNSIV